MPAGWWHCALNLEDTVAVTANFVSRANLPRVLRCLKTRNADLISGCAPPARATLFDRFVAALRRQCPEVLTEWDADECAAAGARASAANLAAIFSDGRELTENQESKSESVATAKGGGFSFGFSV